jgi:endonuclease YncB( thermonuclease family)
MYKYCLIFALLAMPCLSSAEIYRSVDEQGNVVFTDQSQSSSEKIELQTSPYRYRVQLKRVIDGDTIELKSGEKIRLIGINSPEVANRYSEAQPGGEAARAYLKKLLRSPELLLEYDEEQRDRYDRLLAHCFSEQGDYLNAKLVEAGHATLTLTPPNLRYAERLQAAQQAAEKKRLGIWSIPDYQVKTLQAFKPGKSYRGWQRWQLKATAVSQTEKYTRLIVSTHLSLMIPNEHIELFADLENYLNRPFEVRGWLSKRGDQYTIKVVHPSAIILL